MKSDSFLLTFQEMIITETTIDKNSGTDCKKAISIKTKLRLLIWCLYWQLFYWNYVSLISLFISFWEFVLILVLYKMETKLNTYKVLFNKLNEIRFHKLLIDPSLYALVCKS
jgi:hypothetical protein